MYQGANKTAITSQNMFADALLTLLKTNSYESISISQLCTVAKVSRQTFYILFQSKDNVICYIISRNFSFLGKTISKEHKTVNLDQLCDYFIGYVNKNTDFLKLLYKNNLLSLLFSNFYNCILKYFDIFVISPSIEKKYFAGFLAGSLTSIIKIYLETDSSKTSSSLYETTYTLLSGSVFKQ